MADAPKEPTEAGKAKEGEAKPKGKKKLVILGGGGVTLVALAYLAAMMALPSKPKRVSFNGPFVAPLTTSKIQVNLSDSKSYLVVDLKVMFEAVDRAYYDARSTDEVYTAELTDALVSIASSKTREEMADKVTKPVFLEEVRRAVDPLLFPVHIGSSKTPYEADKASGLKPGLSCSKTTLRANFGEHLLHVDAKEKTLAIDDGEPASFEEGATDVELSTPGGEKLFLDVSGLKEGFVGDVPIGIKGRVRQVMWNEILIQ